MIAHYFMRVVTALFVCVWGGILIAFFLFGYFFGPREPPSGVTWEEHRQTIESGYYKRESVFGIVVTGIYMVTLLLPHGWIVRRDTWYRAARNTLRFPYFFVGGLFVTGVFPMTPLGVVDVFDWLFIMVVLTSLFVPAWASLRSSRELYEKKLARTPAGEVPPVPDMPLNPT